MRRHRFNRAAALALALAAFAVPTAAAQQDLRSPDARDAARAAAPHQDLRSPDTRDVGTRHFVSFKMTPVPAPTAAARPDTNSEWLDAGLAMLLFAAVGGACVVVAVTRRHGGGRVVTALADGTRDWRRGAGL
jgi:hypothetical protein